jgi:hypothetical protein
MRRGVAILLALASCFDAQDPSGGSCVPGQATMCWCDGLTPGVQTCGPANTYEPCVCGDTDGPVSTSEASSGMAGESSGPGLSSGPEPGADTTAAPGSSTSGDAGSESSEGEASTGEPVPTECTDMDYAFWIACRSIAYAENPSPCMPCVGGNSCEIAQCSLDCAALGNPGLDAAMAACDAEYQLCADLSRPPPPTAYGLCMAACTAPTQECIAAIPPPCDIFAVSACYMTQNECTTACQDKL